MTRSSLLSIVPLDLGSGSAMWNENQMILPELEYNTLQLL